MPDLPLYMNGLIPPLELATDSDGPPLESAIDSAASQPPFPSDLAYDAYSESQVTHGIPPNFDGRLQDGQIHQRCINFEGGG